MLKRTMSLMLIALFALSVLTGCNTIRGAGQDIEEGGEAVQRSAD